MKLRAVGNKVLVERILLKSKDASTRVLVPVETKGGHPGHMIGGKVLSAGEDCKVVNVGDMVLLDAGLQPLSFGHDESEFFIYEHFIIAVVEDLEDWIIDKEPELPDVKKKILAVH